MKTFIRIVSGAVVLAAFILSMAHISKTVNTSLSLTPIVIDAGHGGMDSGTVGKDGSMEKDINLDIALRLCDKFSAAGYPVYMTRTDDFKGQSWATYNKSADMTKRVELINSLEDAVVISVHQNSCEDASLSGAQVFYSTNNADGMRLAECIRQSICEKLQPGNSRQTKEGNDLSRILFEATPPTVIVECGFMSNENELRKLKDEGYREGMAYAIFTGTQSFLKG